MEIELSRFALNINVSHVFVATPRKLCYHGGFVHGNHINVKCTKTDHNELRACLMTAFNGPALKFGKPSCQLLVVWSAVVIICQIV